MIIVTDSKVFQPVSTQYMIIGLLKSLYSKEIICRLQSLEASRKNLFCKANGNEKILSWIQEETYIAWKMIHYQREERKNFEIQRKKYLLPYSR